MDQKISNKLGICNLGKPTGAREHKDVLDFLSKDGIMILTLSILTPAVSDGGDMSPVIDGKRGCADAEEGQTLRGVRQSIEPFANWVESDPSCTSWVGDEEGSIFQCVTTNVVILLDKVK